MQRSAAKPTNTPSTPSTPAGPPSKRQRLSTGSSFPTTTSSDYEAVRAALAAEELKRAQAIERQAAEAGETRWGLSFRDPEEGGERMRVGKVEARFVHPLPHLLLKALLKRLPCMGEFDYLWVLMCYRTLKTQLPRLSLQIQIWNFQKTTTTILMTQLQA